MIDGPTDGDVQEVKVPSGARELPGSLGVPEGAHAVVVFAHGLGSGRNSPRGEAIAKALRSIGFATLLFDMVRPDAGVHMGNGGDVAMLVDRLAAAVQFVCSSRRTKGMPVGCFAASAGAMPALIAATKPDTAIRALVIRSGRTDIAEDTLGRVTVPTRLIVGGGDERDLAHGLHAMRTMTCRRSLDVLPGGDHDLDEPGVRSQVAALVCEWLLKYVR